MLLWSVGITPVMWLRLELRNICWGIPGPTLMMRRSQVTRNCEWMLSSSGQLHQTGRLAVLLYVLLRTAERSNATPAASTEPRAEQDIETHAATAAAVDTDRAVSRKYARKY